jgi:hypothetical protein
MMKLTYNGTDERVFPTLGITVKPGDEFDAPEGFSHPDCSGTKAAPTKSSFKPDARDGDKDGLIQDNTPFERPVTTPTPSAASDTIVKESE